MIEQLERIPVQLSAHEKKKFKVQTAKNSQNMTEVLRTFIVAYNKNPKIYGQLVQSK